MAKLGDVCTIVSGTTPKTSVPEYWDGTLNWITPAELNEDTFIINESQRKITEEGAKSCGLTPFPAGTVILSSRAPIGKTAIAGTEMYCNQGFKNLICSDVIFNQYLFWFLRGNTEYLNSLGRGATFKEISKKIVQGIEIPLPSIERQKEIASVLDKISSLISLRKQQLEKLDELVKARFVEMFGDLADNNCKWKTGPLNNHADILVGYPFPSSGYTEEGIRIVGGYNLMQGFIKLEDSRFWPDVAKYEQYLLNKDDIVMAMDRPWVNGGFKIAMITDNCLPAVLIQRTACIRGKDINQRFLFALLNSPRFAKHCNITGSLVPHISNKDINSYEIILPPYELQEEYGDYISKLERIEYTIQTSVDKLKTLKNALMQEYFE